jgi:hypothetical protein
VHGSGIISRLRFRGVESTAVVPQEIPAMSDQRASYLPGSVQVKILSPIYQVHD